MAAGSRTMLRGFPYELIVPMLIACPDCNAGYDVPDALLTSARMTRCAACGHDWMTEAADAAPADSAAATEGSDADAPAIEKINCPTCAAVYEVPAVMLAVPRMMRCAACGHDWETPPRGAMPRHHRPPTPACIQPDAAARPAEPAISELTAPPASPGLTAPAPMAAASESQASESQASESQAGEFLAEKADAGVDDAGLAAADGPDHAPDMPADAIASLPAEAEVPALSLAQRLQTELRTSRISLVGWAVSAVLLVIMAQTLAGHRAAIAEAWPPSQRLFLWLGLG